ncbi:rhomboid family intramembrane serine protease [Aestuariivirga litoralis]|uniref:rhomboid family intramembrane serine protease n=1 Tax=Aestuariivirga litoralis TaxID=2650924 RepID=UPI0013798824|nr:rhomboid family intramembrane serine protease [Aestuariivirga litoralis]
MSEQQYPRGNWGPVKPPPAFNVPAIVAVVIGLLAAIFVGLWLGGQDWEVWSLAVFALIPSRFTDPGLPMLQGSQYWSLATYMLLHGSWMHLAFNCIWLLIFGTPVARYLGNGKFLAICLVSGVAGGLASLFLHWGQEIVVVGASGAVMGLMAAAIPLMYGERLPRGGWRPASLPELLRNRRALVFTGVVLAITLFSGGTGWTGNSFLADSGIAWEAHIGGFFGGLLAFYVLAPRVQHV